MDTKVKLTKEELQVILNNHIVWLKNLSKGSRANLSGANLFRTDLSRANLSRANLYRADLYRANFENATFVKGWTIVKA